MPSQRKLNNLVTEAEAKAKLAELGNVFEYAKWLRSQEVPRILEMDEFRTFVREWNLHHGKPVPSWAEKHV